MPSRTVRIGRFFAKIREKAVHVFGRDPAIHLSAFVEPNSDGYLTFHVTNERKRGRGRRHWLPKFLPEHFVDVMTRLEAEIIEAWIEASEEVDLHALEAAGWLVMTLPPNATEWFKQQLDGTTFDVKELRTRFYREVWACPAPGEARDDAIADALLRHALAPTQLNRRHTDMPYPALRIDVATGAVEELVLTGYCTEDGSVAWFARPKNWLPAERLVAMVARNAGPKLFEAMMDVADRLGMNYDRAKVLDVIQAVRSASETQSAGS